METDQNKFEQQLEKLRCDIDEIDHDIVDLINKRLVLGSKIGDIKNKTGSMVLDKKREKKVLQRLARINSGPADEDVLRYIFSVIMTATRQIQKSSRISYLGPEASFSHIAALNHFKHSGQFVEQKSIREVFKEIEKKESRYGVVPVENSIEGAVNHTLDLFYEFDLNIVAEHYEHISHDLLSVSGNIKDIKKIYSHPQALAQARGWIRKKLPGAHLIETSSTSKAARIASKEPDAAAVASSRAAFIYNLQVVESKIEDYSGNVTRFLVIGNEKAGRTGRDKTSIMFATSHVPGALFNVLDPVKRAGLNMVKLESRPTKHQNWSYYFFMDIEGHFTDKSVKETVEKMKDHSLFLKILGAYPVNYNN
ncbi:MAG: prephenate dehydratase [Thermodesulfobacteriota bacterium]|nr:prephenate dehydratase [Thermodesulfobacteriota bacterium]